MTYGNPTFRWRVALFLSRFTSPFGYLVDAVPTIHWSGVSDGWVPKRTTWRFRLRRAERVLAANPLLPTIPEGGRDAALEEAAKLCDRRVEVWARDAGSNPRGHCSLSLEEECQDIAAAIRGLKGRANTRNPGDAS